LAQLQSPSRELSPRLVLIRFCVRLAILLAFAAFGSVGFGKSLAALLAMSAILCIVVAMARREGVFPRALNHFDEALVYGALYFLTVGIGLSSPL
jgi:hypothetical protein